MSTCDECVFDLGVVCRLLDLMQGRCTTKPCQVKAPKLHKKQLRKHVCIWVDKHGQPSSTESKSAQLSVDMWCEQFDSVPLAVHLLKQTCTSCPRLTAQHYVLSRQVSITAFAAQSIQLRSTAYMLRYQTHGHRVMAVTVCPGC